MTGQQAIDMRGRPCPEPVVATRKALAEMSGGTLRVLVDNEASVDNVSRMATSMGWVASVERSGDAEFEVVVTREGATVQSTPGRDAVPGTSETPLRVVVFIASSLFGEGSEELGRILMRSFIKTIKELVPLPECVVFANSGVHLVTEDSDLVDDLEHLVESGIRILACGTCLDYYHLSDKLAVGNASNMYEIATTLASADRLVRP